MNTTKLLVGMAASLAVIGVCKYFVGKYTTEVFDKKLAEKAKSTASKEPIHGGVEVK